MQEVYKLSRQQHLSYREIAERMGISSETVKKHIQGALRLIRTDLTFHTFILFMLAFYLPSKKKFDFLYPSPLVQRTIIMNKIGFS